MKILVADDDNNLRKVLLNELSEAGFEADEASNGTLAKELLEKNEYDVLLLDLIMPGTSGLDVLKSLKKNEILTEVIVLTANATVSTAVDAMKSGAYDYLTKPFQIEELVAIIGKAYEKKQLLSENLLLKLQVKRQAKPDQIITQNPVMIKVMENVKKFANSDMPVLIFGESGVGKELVAKAIHSMSNRADGPFIPINCGAIPETMIENELFGHEKGAFTSAHEKKLGLLEIAHNGILFLDEIGELSLALQLRLLRVIETQKFFRVGGTKELKVNVRFVSATNKDVKKEIKSGGKFRSDLYYRISTFTLMIPPLRERTEDIPLLVNYFIKNNASFRDKKLSKKALEALSHYSWPGNIRELQNVVYRTLFLTSKDIVEPQDLPPDIFINKQAVGKTLADIEKDYILRVLREVKGRKKKASEILGIDPKTLYRKLLDYGIEGESDE